jgi:hypothetical protein
VSRKPKLDTRLTNKQFGVKRGNQLSKVAREANSAGRIFWQCCCFNSIEPNVGAEARTGSPLSQQVLWFKGCSMEFKEYDFVRNPVVQDEVFFLESKCAVCGSSILARSIEELVDLEELHRAQCEPSNAVAERGKHENSCVY